MKLNELKPFTGSTKARIRVGRGIGSGKGKTCGRGGKGQTARTGVAINGFEGGQQPIYRRLPKRGFFNVHRTEYQVINLSDLQKAVDAGKFTPGQKINREALKASGLVKNVEKPVKLLGKGELKTLLILEVDAASASALKVMEKQGGKVVLPVQATAA